MPKTRHVEVLVVTYNARRALKRCLRSLIRHTASTRISIIVVDNCSTDGTSDFLRTAWNGKARIIRTESNLGFSGGVNRGLRECQNEYVVLLDDDVEVQENWLEGLLREMRKSPRIGIVGPKVIDFNQRIFSADYIVPLLYLNGNGEHDSAAHEYVRRCDALVGPCWLIRRSMLGEVGYFDESFYPSQHEDIDFCLRARLAGYFIVYNGKVTVKHDHLFRAGTARQRAFGYSAFLSKWKGRLSDFPLRDSHLVDRHVSRCLKHIEAQELQQALGEYKKASPFKCVLLEQIMQGLQCDQEEKYREAIAIMLQVHAKYPNNAGLRQLSLLYQKAGLYKEAQRVGKRFLEVFHRRSKQKPV